MTALALDDFPPIVIRTMADNARQLAADLDAAADAAAMRIRDRRNSADYRRRVLAACKAACESIDRGTDADKAVLDAATRYCVPVDSVRLLRPAIASRIKSARQIETDRQIMRSYRAGLTDVEIGKRLNLHQKTVARRRRQIMREI
ncbi:hypothetical protein GCM10007972_27750 [Iodidimonas muriae]|uniref:HTH luxR-type domain-containing protein n=1 Tax=Iodidimonas muriae TaxID=261467 RepID=A0ABQ2LGK5_9PROT|nr:hypothetical protein [Iodidimonas muriae]GER08816.1 hypothetical protein JCM17843_31260 [Kordiimonadales bacterium JCM 17843]GGO17556.1 hypothetical protein GCM10007972_27750 [Iodidimonas muriae]